MDVKKGVLTASESGGNILSPCIIVRRKSDEFRKTIPTHYSDFSHHGYF